MNDNDKQDTASATNKETATATPAKVATATPAKVANKKAKRKAKQASASKAQTATPAKASKAVATIKAIGAVQVGVFRDNGAPVANWQDLALKKNESCQLAMVLVGSAGGGVAASKACANVFGAYMFTGSGKVVGGMCAGSVKGNAKSGYKGGSQYYTEPKHLHAIGRSHLSSRPAKRDWTRLDMLMGDKVALAQAVKAINARLKECNHKYTVTAGKAIAHWQAWQGFRPTK